MADENVDNIDSTVDTPVSTSMSESMQNSIWGDGTPPKQSEQPAEPVDKPAAVADTPPLATEDVLNPTAYLKSKWGFESEEAADNEIKNLREKANKTFEFKNEDSRLIAEYINEGKEDELYKLLDTKQKVKKLISADLSDKNVATDLVKFGLQKDNPNLDSTEVDFLFNEKYSIPKEPVKKEDEEEEDFNERHSIWESQKNTIEKRLIIEAKMNQPKLAQYNTELVIPKIQRENEAPKEPSQEDLIAFNKEKESFLQSALQTANGFTGFAAQVKDKDVDFPVNYTPSTEEKTFVESTLKRFVESGFDANAILAERWVGADGKTLNINQITEDLYRIIGGNKVDHKLALDSANKRMDIFLKEKKNVHLNDGNPNGTFKPNGDKSHSEKMQENFWN